MRWSTCGSLVLAALLSACGGPEARIETGEAGPQPARTSGGAENEIAAIQLEPDLVSCAPGRVAAPGRPIGDCAPGARTFVSVPRRLRAVVPELASSCRAGGEVVVRFAVEGDGRVTDLEVVRSTADAASTERALELVAGIEQCPPEGGQRTTITYSLLLR
jgi:TonB family protein